MQTVTESAAQEATSAVAPAPPSPPLPPAQAGEVATVVIVDGIPQTAAEVQALRARRSELSDQIISASRRREDLVEEISDLPEHLRAGVEQRVAILDERILDLETQIAETGRQLSQSPAIATAGTLQLPAQFPVGEVTAVSIVFTVLVLCPLAVAWARRMLRRPLPAAEASPLLKESAERLERLEHAVEAIAIEVERVSEGQRFVTRVLGEGKELRR